jgi:hypothetical protein
MKDLWGSNGFSVLLVFKAQFCLWKVYYAPETGCVPPAKAHDLPLSTQSVLQVFKVSGLDNMVDGTGRDQSTNQKFMVVWLIIRWANPIACYLIQFYHLVGVLGDGFPVGDEKDGLFSVISAVQVLQKLFFRVRPGLGWRTFSRVCRVTKVIWLTYSLATGSH